ncbi:MAG: hypothetical protein JXR95_03605 [Deltaproteobacteria bacterium]|nr:hypothetical protein [Deltaproteobacteria bacterium]
MTKTTPLQMVKEKFGSKDKLVEKVVDLIAQGKEEKEELADRLKTAANAKLLRLFEVGSEIKENYGSKEKLVEKILEFQNKVKDMPYKAKLEKLSLPRLIDMVKRYEKK